MSRIVRCPGTLFTWIQPLALAAVASLKSSRIAIRSLLLTAMTFAAVAPSTGTSAELISRNALFPAPAASAPKLNDLNGDGKSDLVMRNANGIIAVFQMNGATVEMQNVLPPSEHRELRLAGDFDQDGKIDLVSLGGSPGTTVLSLMEGTMVRESQIVYAGVGAYAAHPVAVGDLNGDGFADIVFE